MPTKETPKFTAADTTADVAAVATSAPAAALPALGSTCTVRVADGLLLTNNETGGRFAPGEATSQTVTITTLRRLVDGDLVLVA